MFDALMFIGNRNSGQRVSDQEAFEFNLYNALQAVSMDPRMIRYVVALNTVEFSHLPKDIQARIYNGFNNRNIDPTWCRAKSADIAAKENFIEKAMKVYEMPYNSVLENMRHGLIDRMYVEEKYAYKFEGRPLNMKKFTGK